MTAEYSLSGPFISLTMQRRPSRLFVVLFFVASLLFGLVVMGLYAFVLPAFVGFESSVLIGIAFIAMVVGQ